MTNKHHQQTGFTLIELLVSMAIFTTIMSGVFLMFNSAVRVTKQAYLNQAAFETVRGTFDTIERDLTRSFVSRDTGHKHTFYGTPIGFTFIGLISTDGEDNYNVARITYVIYGGDNPELTRTLNSTADDETEQKFIDDEDYTLKRTTYSLLRYIEPGIDDLESFPINWARVIPDTGGNSLSSLVTFAVNNSPCIDDACKEEVAKAKRREIWIRLVAGDTNIIPGFDFWSMGNFRSGGLDSLTLDPADYVLAENILHIRRNRRLQDDESGLDEDEKAFNPENNQTYTTVNTAPFGLVDPFIDTLGLDLAIIESLDVTHVNYSQTDAFKIQDQLNSAPIPHDNYFFAYREYGEQDRFDENGNTVFKVNNAGVLLNDIPETEFEAKLFAYWNDTRNLEHNSALSAYNLIPANNTNNDPAEDLISTQPDIIDPTLPESILIQLAFFYPSPYPGAPDFEKVFTHNINLPTAYKRKQESLDTKNLRSD